MLSFPLEILYVPSKKTFYFHRENVQEALYKHININDVICFLANDDIDSINLKQVKNLDKYKCFYDLQMLNEDEIRYCETITRLSNGIEIKTDLNLTEVTAPNLDMLFCFMTPVFESMSYKSLDLYKELIDHPNELMVFEL